MRSIAKEITIYDIAEKLNVSGCTVSRALQNNPLVNERTSQRIQDMAKLLGYRSNQFARNLRIQRTNTLGVIVPQLDTSLMSKVISGMEKTASHYNLNLIVKQSFGLIENEINIAADLFECRVDGLLVSSPKLSREIQHYTQFTERGTPVVFLDAVPPSGRFTNVSVDNRNVTKKAVTHLINEGCRRVVYITSKCGSDKYAEGIEGYKDALRLAGIRYDSNYIIHNNLSYEAGIDASRTILNMKVLPDGVFVASDICAVSCMTTLKSAGLSIPKDIAFVACNNFDFATVVEPNLTTLNNPGNAIGEAAMKYVVSNLNNEYESMLAEVITIQPELMIRKSSMKKLSKYD